MPLAIINHDYQLVAVLAKKCASSSIRRLFLELPKHGPDQSYIRDYNSSHIFENNMSARWIPTEKLADFQRSHRDYTWFTVVRNPYLRALSNYFNKINILTKRHHRLIYYYGKLCKLFGGYSAWNENGVSLRGMRTLMTFEQFLASLQVHGLDDDHFTPQSTQIGFNSLQFDRILRVERLDDDLPRFLRECGASFPVCQKSVPTLNNSDYRKSLSSYFTPQSVSVINSLYDEDFVRLGYDRKIKFDTAGFLQKAA